MPDMREILEIAKEDAPPTRKPWWLILGVLVCLGMVYLWIRG